MFLQVFKSKIHRGTITGAELNYMGSITIDPVLIEAAGMIVGERVQIVNIDNGERLETYIIEGERGAGEIVLNGPAARKVQKGDKVIIIGYAFCTPEEASEIKPKIVFPNDNNQLV